MAPSFARRTTPTAVVMDRGVGHVEHDGKRVDAPDRRAKAAVASSDPNERAASTTWQPSRAV